MHSQQVINVSCLHGVAERILKVITVADDVREKFETACLCDLRKTRVFLRRYICLVVGKALQCKKKRTVQLRPLPKKAYLHQWSSSVFL